MNALISTQSKVVAVMIETIGFIALLLPLGFLTALTFDMCLPGIEGSFLKCGWKEKLLAAFFIIFTLLGWYTWFSYIAVK